MPINDYSIEELQAEIDRKKKVKISIPEPINWPDVTNLQNRCQAYIAALAEEDIYVDDDAFKEYIFEAALETFYGKDILVWINQQLE